MTDDHDSSDEYDDYDDDIDDVDDEHEDGDLPPLTEACVALHEVYLALISGGFSEWEGLRLIAWVIAEEGLAS